MEHLTQPDVSAERDIPFWKNPCAWLRGQKLSRDYWVFFTAAFFFDFGFAVYHFLFNLYLLDLHFNERAIGLIGSAARIGSVAGTLPVGLLARKFGVRPLLLTCFVVAPLLGALRIPLTAEREQIGLAFVSGLAMCMWGVCFLPAIARTTTDENRQSAFSLIVSVSIGTSMLGGIVCGYAPQWLQKAGFVLQPADAKGLMLLISCGIAALGILAVLRMRQPQDQDLTTAAVPDRAGLSRWKPDRFLMQFLPAMALWTIVVTSFSPFANIYLSKVLHLPFSRVGLVFSISQVVQLVIGMLTPLLFRVMGLINGITATQLATAVAVGCLAGTHNPQIAVGLFLSFSALQWMAAPGMYNLLMSRVRDEERSTASSMMMFCNALAGSAATAVAGLLFTRFGYPPVLLGIAVVAVLSALTLRSMIGRQGKTVT
jgi:MFS family permease